MIVHQPVKSGKPVLHISFFRIPPNVKPRVFHKFLLKILDQIPKILIIMVVFAAGAARGQVSSSAFDPNCYQPVIGMPGVVDSIYCGYEAE